MSFLLIETATDRSIIAVGNLQKVVSQIEFDTGSNVVDVLPDLLKKAGLQLGSIVTIICGVGPGSYTGIRVAISFSMGLFRGLEAAFFENHKKPNVQLLPVTTLAGFVPTISPLPVPFIAALDAKIGGVYCWQGVLSQENSCQWVGEPLLVTNEEFVERANGVECVVTTNRNWIDKKGLPIQSTVLSRAPCATALTSHAFSTAHASAQIQELLPTPLYLRKTQAEIEKAATSY